jgi:hypothetical protein
VPGTINQNDNDFEEASCQLDEGLKSCRAVVSGYRALLTPEEEAVEKDAESAKPDGADESPSA